MLHGFLVDDRSRPLAPGFGSGDDHIVQDVDFGAEPEGDGLEAVGADGDALEGAMTVRDGTVAVTVAVGMGQDDIGKVERLGAKAVEETD